MDRQISLTINWMRVGFIHGVMNTDNVTLSGETIDYGPCAFMDYYHPNTVFSSIDQKGRYSFMNQEIVCHWNLGFRLCQRVEKVRDVFPKSSFFVVRQGGLLESCRSSSCDSQ